MRLILVGAPGSGKGTQAQRLVDRQGVRQISTGDILRGEIASKSPLGEKADEYVSRGSLVPDDVMLEMMELRLAEDDVAHGFLLDGFPRSIPQAEGLDRLMERTGLELDAVIKLDVPKMVLLERLTCRRVCVQCQAVSNKRLSPTKMDGVCDRCGGDLFAREDDQLETAKHRLLVYEAETAPLIDYYDAKGLLAIINGDRPIEEVGTSIERMLEERAAKGR